MAPPKAFLTVLISILIQGTYGDSCSSMITSRSSWGARAPKLITAMKLPVSNTLIHHSEGPSCSTPEACKRVVRGIQNYHQDVRKWDDIGYNFLVGGDGQVYEGRGWNRTGAHSPNWNDKSIGICLLGSFSKILPPKEQLDATKKLIECGVNNGYITSDYKLYGHRDTRATTCPGDRLYQEISTWPHKA